MPLTDEQKVQLAELLGNAEEGDLPSGFVTQSVLQGRLTAKDKARQLLEAKHAEEREAMETEHATSAKKLRDMEREAMTAAELAAADQVERDARFTASETARAEATTRATAAEQLATETWLNNQLANALGSSATPPANLATAVREARAELGIGASLTEGQFSLSLTADGQPVDKPAEALGTWYTTRADLHGRGGGVLPLPGGGHGRPGDPPPVDPLEGKSPTEQLRIATAAVSSTLG